MKLLAPFLTVGTLVLLTVVRAAVPLYGQCGGKSYAGDTFCASGTECTVQSEWYSQCMPSSNSANAPPMTAPVTIPAAPTSTHTASPVGPSVPPMAQAGYIGVNGTQFTLDGNKFTVVGTNSYWVGLMGLSADNMDKAFADIAATGATVVRTWGFNDVTNANGIYYQSWSEGQGTINKGASGLENFDKVIAAAKKNGLRLIVALTNNWSDYGGMDVYVKQITGSSNHDLFYTNEDVKNAFKFYAHGFMGHYITEPTIMAWELANEPRCKGSSGATSGQCKPATITAWAKEISAFIKSIDPYHLVAVGDEGFYNQPGAPTYPYQGSEGVDFDANLQLPDIDFGTFHAYPGPWGQSGNELKWGTQWITDHAASMKKYNKPVIIEEFGVTSNKDSVYTAWLNEVLSSGLTGDLIWQAGSRLSGFTSPDDGYAVYPDSSIYTLLKNHAAALKARK